MSRLRRAGGKWRLLVHEWIGAQPDGTTYGSAHHVTNDPAFGGTHPDTVHSRTHVLPASTEFDELVVGRWLHVEQMNTGRWWMNVGGVTLWVEVDRDGRPTRVTTYPAGEYADPVPGCAYRDGDS
jgi:hypothetical protein